LYAFETAYNRQATLLWGAFYELLYKMQAKNDGPNFHWLGRKK
jgi:hypothetical protein